MFQLFIEIKSKPIYKVRKPCHISGWGVITSCRPFTRLFKKTITEPVEPCYNKVFYSQ